MTHGFEFGTYRSADDSKPPNFKPLKNPPIKLSMVIPHWPGAIGADECLEKLIKSVEDQVDELIVEVNDGIGFGAAVNLGLQKVTGNYVIIANNDSYLAEGNLIDLVGPINHVTTPRIIPEPRDNFPRAFYCLSTDLYKIILVRDGYFYDERFEIGYFEDDDMIIRMKQHGIFFDNKPEVIVYHKDGGGLSMKQMGEQKFYDLNKQRYDEKWRQ